MPRTTRTKRLPTLSPSPPAPVAPSKRSQDDMAGKAKVAENGTATVHSPEPEEQPPTKKSKRVVAAAKAHSDPLEGPSITSRVRRPSVRDAEPKRGGVPAPHEPGGRDNPIMMRCGPAGVVKRLLEETGEVVYPDRPRRSPHQSLTRAHARVVELEAELKDVHYKLDQAVKRAQQDDILGRELQKEKYAELEKRYRRSLGRHNAVAAELEKRSVCIADLTQKAATLEQQIQALDEQRRAVLKVERENIRMARRETDYWRTEAEHSQTLVRTMEEDFHDLSRLETENRARSQREHERNDTLPPAYGALDDEDRAESSRAGVARVEEAEDGGRLEVATFKRAVRQTFMTAVEKAEERFRQIGRDGAADLGFAYAEPYMLVTMSLQVASRNVEDALNRSGDFFTDRIRACAGQDPKTAALVIHRGLARQEFVADRAAKLLLDLAVRALAALEVHPAVCASLSKAQITNAALSWTALDEVLLKALRALLNEGPADNPKLVDIDEKLWTMQYFVMQIQMIKGRINSSSATMVHVTAAVGAAVTARRVADGRQFDQTRDWLLEQIETERMIAANFGNPEDEDDEPDEAEAESNAEQGAEPEAEQEAEQEAEPEAEMEQSSEDESDDESGPPVPAPTNTPVEWIPPRQNQDAAASREHAHEPTGAQAGPVQPTSGPVDDLVDFSFPHISPEVAQAHGITSADSRTIIFDSDAPVNRSSRTTQTDGYFRQQAQGSASTGQQVDAHEAEATGSPGASYGFADELPSGFEDALDDIAAQIFGGTAVRRVVQQSFNHAAPEGEVSGETMEEGSEVAEEGTLRYRAGSEISSEPDHDFPDDFEDSDDSSSESNDDSDWSDDSESSSDAD